MKKTLTLLALALVASTGLFAQQKSRVLDRTNMRDGESVEYCTTHKKTAEALKNDPVFAAQYQATQIALEQQAEAKKQGQNGTEKATVYKIPVVFHVLHFNGVENISREQIVDQVAILNRDYRLQNADAATVHPDFQGLPADIEIEFALATKAPDGSCFTGITRTVSPLTFDGSDGQAQITAIVNGNDVYNGQWPPNKYMNVYICQEIGGAAGYTFNPAGGTSMFYNGIFLLHNYCGSIGTSTAYTSRSLTHEVGHWLNLSHTWGGNNNPGNASSCSSDDGVTDTPNTIGVTSCNLNEATCGPRANVENYMDYSYCSKMFTPGQKTRMRNALTSSTAGRNNLYTSTNLSATGVGTPLVLCQAKFSSTKQVVCIGDVVDFTDESYNAASGWNWTFNGGTPASSTSQNPSVTYTTPGTYTVVLTATDGTTSNTKTQTNYITVLPASTGLPFYEGFEGLTTLAGSTWFVNNLSGNGWDVTNTTGNTGSKSAKLTNFGQTAGNLDEFSSSAIDLSSINATNGVTLSFRYAYRKTASADNDNLKVLLTSNCGNTWDVRKTLTASTMTAGQTATSSWTPTASNFVTVHMTNVTSQYWLPDFRFKFLFTSGGGNNVYVDDINIYAGAPSDPFVLAGLNDLENIQNVSLYPNPTDGDINLAFNALSAEKVNVIVTDLAGKIIQKNYIQTNEGQNVVILATENLAAGMYLVNIAQGAGAKTMQFVVK